MMEIFLIDYFVMLLIEVKENFIFFFFFQKISMKKIHFLFFLLSFYLKNKTKEYPETTITSNPEVYKNSAPPYLNSWRSTRFIGNQNDNDQLENILHRISIYCKQRGIDILTTMEQYDKHQMGEITESQFYRAFIGPKLNENEMTLLRDKYSDPDKPGLINYLNFVQDLNQLSIMKSNQIFNLSSTNSLLTIENQVLISFSF